MRVLHVTPELPFFPGGSGGSTRQFMLLADLVRRGHEVDVVAPVAPEQRDGAATLGAAGITLHAAHRPDSRIAETGRALLRSPSLVLDAVRLPLLAWQVEVFWRSLQAPLREAVLTHVPDVIAVEHDWAARWRLDLPAGIPLALTLENLSWHYYERRATAAGGTVSRALLTNEARRFARFDARHFDDYDVLLAMSERDRDEVAAMSTTRCEVIANGVDTRAIGAGDPAGRDPVAVFVGSFAYPPNAEALAWLLEDLWPRVLGGRPDARLVVVGRDVPPRLQEGAPAGVTFAGFVPEMSAVYDEARAVLCPMRSGGGTRLKVLEGLATGLPLVSTTMGAEGVAVTDGADVLLADEPQAFADTVVRVLGDDALAARIGTGGRALALERYDWQAIGERLEAVLASLAG
jgi:glycosyltransferase involved in cell wall biosynthesis